MSDIIEQDKKYVISINDPYGNVVHETNPIDLNTALTVMSSRFDIMVKSGPDYYITIIQSERN